MKKVIRYFFGYLKIVVEGNYVERFINLCSYKKIEIWNLKPGSHSYEMCIRMSDFKKLKPVLRKTSSKIYIQEKYGFPVFMHRHRKRQCFLFSFMCCVFFLYVSTFFIWNIQVEGNLYCTDEVLIETLKKENIMPGIRKTQIDCPEIAQFLRKTYDNVTWASVYIDGTILRVHIKENNESSQISEKDESEKAEAIVAESAGKITSIITRNGTPQIHEGDLVKEGDILVSGEIEIKNDASEVVAYQYLMPEADITAEVTMDYVDKLSPSYNEKKYTNRKKRSLCIETPKNIYILGNSNIKFKNYTSESRKISFIPGIHLEVKTAREYTNQRRTYTEKQYHEILKKNFSKFCKELEKKGVQILTNSVKIYTERSMVYAKGTLTVCKEFGIKKEIPKKVLQEGKIYGNP